MTVLSMLSGLIQPTLCPLSPPQGNLWLLKMADIQNISLDSPGSVGAVAVPVVFALIFLLGMVGNGLVLAVLLQPGPSAWQEPGSTTDLFILNLAVADLCFILCCVPFQAAIYTLDAWLFGAFVCKTVHLLIYLTMYAMACVCCPNGNKSRVICFI